MGIAVMALRLNLHNATSAWLWSGTTVNLPQFFSLSEALKDQHDVGRGLKSGIDRVRDGPPPTQAKLTF